MVALRLFPYEPLEKLLGPLLHVLFCLLDYSRLCILKHLESFLTKVDDTL